MTHTHFNRVRIQNPRDGRPDEPIYSKFGGPSIECRTLSISFGMPIVVWKRVDRKSGAIRPEWMTVSPVWRLFRRTPQAAMKYGGSLVGNGRVHRGIARIVLYNDIAAVLSVCTNEKS